MTTQQLAIQDKANNIKDLLAKARKEIEAALPKHITPDRMLRIALTEARKTPDLLECTPASFLGAVIQSAQLGLEPGSGLGQAWLIPFKNRKTNQLECSFIPGYKGYISLLARTPEAPIVTPRAVYDGDQFEFEYGLNEKLVHVPGPNSGVEPKLTHVYVVYTLKDGRKTFSVMSRGDIEKIRSLSKAGNFGPWKDHYTAMALKTVIRSSSKYLSMSSELQRAISLDEQADAGESQRNELFVASESEPIQTKSERIQGKMLGAQEEPGPETKQAEQTDFENSPTRM